MPAMLTDQVILITGAARGIGRGAARAVLEAGARAVLTDLEPASAEAAAAHVDPAGDRTVALAADVTDERAVARAIEAGVRRFGRLDGLVASAGVLAMGGARDAPLEGFDRQLEVNLRGLYVACRAAAERMIAQGSGGAIVNVASNAGKVGYPDMAGYNASKAAVVSLTRSLAAEWAEHRINVNAVCPGGVATPMLRQVAHWIAERDGGDAEALFASMTPRQLGRHVRPIEVGRVIAFLLSEDAVIIRGQAINVDGGDTPY